MKKNILIMTVIALFSNLSLQASSSDKWRERIRAIEKSEVVMIKTLWKEVDQLNRKFKKAENESSEKVLLKQKINILLIKIDHALVDENPENINSVSMVKLMPWNERLVAMKKNGNSKIKKLWESARPLAKELKLIERGTEKHQEVSAKLNVIMIQIDKLLADESEAYKARFNAINNVASEK